MKCPWCDSEMISGKIEALGDGGNLQWLNEDEELGWFESGGERIGTQPSKGFWTLSISRERLEGFRCLRCRKIVICESLSETERLWAIKSDAELRTARNDIDKYDRKAQQIIRDEAQRRINRKANSLRQTNKSDSGDQ